MTQKRADRAPLALARIRLVGFHNFVDETIEIGAGGAAIGGHLFLLGDNGSGKTTVLDAIHVALTGGDIELNAAARVGGRRHEGRSLAGIVLRQGPSGIVREGASIAYAVLELASATERHVVGVGLAATTLDAMVTRWGIVHRGTLEDVALTVAGREGRRPRTRDELATVLGPKAVVGRIGEYRARLADLLFGGDAAYERACRLWSVAKAYRELVVSTRDPGALFERFLPAPSSETLDTVRKSLHQLEELEASLRGLEATREYVAGVAACRAEIVAIRRERARLDHTELRLREASLRATLSRLTSERDHARSELAGCAARLADAELRTGRADAALAALTTGDAVVWARDLSARERERDARRSELMSAEATRDLAASRRDAALAARAEARRALEREVCAAEAEARAAIEDASRLPTLLPHCAATLNGAAPSSAAEHELREALATARAAAMEAAVLRHEAARAAPEVMGDDADSGPDAALLDSLGRSRIEAARLFELVEPRASAAIARVRSLEAVVSKDAWRTVVTHEGDLPRARVALAEHAGARLAICAERVDLALPSWVDEILDPPASPLAVRARALLAHELTQVGPVEPPDALGGVTLRGALVRAGEGAALLGSERRARSRTLRGPSVEARAREIDAARGSAEAACASAAAHVERLCRVEQALRALAGPELRALQFALAERERDVAQATHSGEQAEGTALAVSGRLNELERTVEALRAAAAGCDRASIAREVEAAAEAVRSARSARDAEVEARVRWSSRDAELDAHQRDAQLRLEQTIAGIELASAAGLGGFDLAADGALSTVESVTAARTELAQIERARMDELLGDGSRGLRGGAAPLGLALASVGTEPSEDLRVEDRSGSPLESVLAELDRSLEESRAIVSDKTRDLFDVIVVGSLAKQLQRDVEHLHATVLDLNRLLARSELGGVRYAFRVVPRPDRAELALLVRRMSALDPASRTELRGYLEGRRGELGAAGDEPPSLLDYRRWFDYRLVTRATKDDGEETPWTRERRAAGSGGEQGVPNHLIVFALAKLAFDAAGARAMPLLLDEAFQGIDGGRRQGLLAFATELGLQLVVASPDQDGVVAAARKTTTLFVVKDDHGDVHLAPYHYWNRAPATQTALVLEQPASLAGTPVRAPVPI
jgi:hypothetical protein